MSGLIPLTLPTARADKRHSVMYSPAPPAQPRRSSLPSSLATHRVFTARCASGAPPGAPPVLSAAEWKQSIADIKRQHINRRFRTCAARCNEILASIKDQTLVEPVYLISLHVYAATSLEMCARPLVAPSTYRDSLLRQARAHYDEAATLISNAEELAPLKKLAPFSLPSLHSPSGSVSSRAWTSETSFSSPTPSVCSMDDLNVHSQQPSVVSSPRRKKVSFELPKQEVPKFEPYIRPDSPTLGFDDEYFTTALSRQSLPKLPDPAKSPEMAPVVVPAHEVMPDQETTPRASRTRARATSASADLDRQDRSSPLDNADNMDHLRRSLQLSGAASRYCAHLSGLKEQLSQHRANLKIVMETPATYQGRITAGRTSKSANSESLALDRKARIERLRKDGWQRKRFDPSRYEALRNAALAELD